MRKYDIVITANDFANVLHEETISEENLKQKVSELAPECNVDWNRVFTDKRCKYFRHFMPINKTIAKHSYKENSSVYKSGNNVKIYITENLIN